MLTDRSGEIRVVRAGGFKPDSERTRDALEDLLDLALMAENRARKAEKPKPKRLPVWKWGRVNR